MEPETALRELASSISAKIASKPDALGRYPPPVPDFDSAEFAPSLPKEATPRPCAYQFFEQLTESSQRGTMNRIIAKAKACEDLLAWGHAPGYTCENVGQAFLDNYCHALLTGPDGPLRCAAPLGAFVLFGPNTFYRDHHHAPNEIYLALTDGGQWRIGEHDWEQLEAGQTIFIPSNTVHAIRSGSEPLLTFSFWLEAGDMAEIEI